MPSCVDCFIRVCLYKQNFTYCSGNVITQHVGETIPYT